MQVRRTLAVTSAPGSAIVSAERGAASRKAAGDTDGPLSRGVRARATLGSRSRSLLGSVLVGSAAFQTSALWTWPFRRTPAPPRAQGPLLQLPWVNPPADVLSYERMLMPRARRKLDEYFTVKVALSYFRDDTIEFVNVDPVRQSVVSCECTRRVQVSLLKTEFGVLARTLDLVVAEDPDGPVFSNWTVVSLNHSVPRPVEFLSFESLSGAVSGPGVQMRLAAQGLPEAGFEAGYEASMVVSISQVANISQAGSDSDVPVEVAVEVLARAAPR